MAALLDNVPTPIVVLLFALLIYVSIKYVGWSKPGGFQFGFFRKPVLFDNTSRAIFPAAGGGGGESDLFESSSLPEERLF